MLRNGAARLTFLTKCNRAKVASYESGIALIEKVKDQERYLSPLFIIEDF